MRQKRAASSQLHYRAFWGANTFSIAGIVMTGTFLLWQNSHFVWHWQTACTFLRFWARKQNLRTPNL